MGLESLGETPDFRIPDLASGRARCCRAGIGEANVEQVPLEDGDHCQAQIEMGKLVITIDQNPCSKTARTAYITIVDELTRSLPLLTKVLMERTKPEEEFDNSEN